MVKKPQTALMVAGVFLLFFLHGSPVSAVIKGFLAADHKDIHHLYDYSELLDSYAYKRLGLSNGLYDDFAKKKIKAFLSSTGCYIDYDDALNNYALAVLNGKSFDLGNYFESSSAKKIAIPASVQKVTLYSGQIIRVGLGLKDIEMPFSNLDNSSDKLSEQGTNFDKKPEGNFKQPGVENNLASIAILDETAVSVARAQSWAVRKKAHQRFIDIAPTYWQYGHLTGICPEVLYAQAAYETGFGHFNGQVPPSYNNWAGIKTASASGNKPEDHDQFKTPQDGVQAHFNHMAAYVGLRPIGEQHGRYFVVICLPWAGTIKIVEELSGKWAPSANYHIRIRDFVLEMRQ